MKKALTAMLVLCCAACTQAAPLNGLYFGYDTIYRAEVYYWFLADGRVLKGLPQSGLNPSDFETACAAHPEVCGTYTLSGDNLVIQYRSGPKQNWKYNPLRGGFAMNYLIMTPVKKFPAGTHLNGTWSRPFASNFGGVSVTSPTWITFRSDGTYQTESVTGVDSGYGTNAANSRTTGTYSIKGFDLMLSGSHGNGRHSIFPIAGNRLSIDGLVYSPKQ